MSNGMMNFDPAAFVNMETDQVSERRPPLPPGDYTGTIGEVKAVPWTGKSDPSKSGIRLQVPIKLMLTPEVQAELKLPQPELQLTDSVMLDMSDNGGIDYTPGRNGQLRKYRDATGLNVKGEPFAPRMLTGRMVLVKVNHDLYNGEVVEQIGGVAKLG
jgi:hypothetical protein